MQFKAVAVFVLVALASASALTLQEKIKRAAQAPAYAPTITDPLALKGSTVVQVAPNQPTQNAGLGTTTLTSGGAALDANAPCACMGQPKCACASLQATACGCLNQPKCPCAPKAAVDVTKLTVKPKMSSVVILGQDSCGKPPCSSSSGSSSGSSNSVTIVPTLAAPASSSFGSSSKAGGFTSTTFLKPFTVSADQSLQPCAPPSKC